MEIPIRLFECTDWSEFLLDANIECMFSDVAAKIFLDLEP